MKATMRWNNRNKKTKVCVTCGNPLGKYKQKYCDNCNPWNKKYTKCIVCGNPVNSNFNKFCSKKCRDIERKKNKKKASKNHSKNYQPHFKRTIRSISVRTVSKLIKDELGCMKCKNNDIAHAALDFHHIEPKEYRVTDLINSGNMKGFLIEIQKCIVICANCHREITHKSSFWVNFMQDI